jgi:hypothetical protein
MEKKPLELTYGTKYIHEESGGIYLILGKFKFKHPESRKWIESVIYRSVDDLIEYGRTVEDFNDNFTKLPLP